MMKILDSFGKVLLASGLAAAVSAPQTLRCRTAETEFSDSGPVRIDDAFWSPKLKMWDEVTINDVFDKFEGRHRSDGGASDAFRNFDRVAEGRRGTKDHFGEPWYDGLIYETIRGAAGFLAMFPDSVLEARIDAYVDRIAAAQESEESGYLETYTQLDEPGHRFGENGGFMRWQHDIYNAGCLVEAGVHYYRATGKTELLKTAVRFANHMAEYMGEAPKRNIVPAHSLPEEALIELYRLFRDEPSLKRRMEVPVDEKAYRELAAFWIENRGRHCGFPHWAEWGNERSERWIRDNAYASPEFGGRSRPSWGEYAQDSIPVFEQQTIEGHAVRATLLAAGVAAAALENGDPRYAAAAEKLWENMAGRRMFVTGGVGAIHEDEKFGPDYYLPADAYLETCAAVGAAFFSARMHELTGKGMYIDYLERVLYNSLLTAVSLSGDRYTYQNPLNAEKHNRWEWHSCPCCPPMFLKLTSMLPSFVYSQRDGDACVNLFVGSETRMSLPATDVELKLETSYPWQGRVTVTVTPDKEREFGIRIRIPGWASGEENPYGLYESDSEWRRSARVSLAVNGEPVSAETADGYAVIERRWQCGDRIELELPMAPRIITANPAAKELEGLAAVVSGPVVYAFENVDNGSLEYAELDDGKPAVAEYRADLLGGVNVVRTGGTHPLTAVPYYAIANRGADTDHKVWVERRRQIKVRVNAGHTEGTVTPYLYGACIEDVNHEIYGGLYAQMIFGESFEEPVPSVSPDGFAMYGGTWRVENGELAAEASAGGKLVRGGSDFADGSAEVDLRFPNGGGASANAGFLVRVSQPRVGADAFFGYEISLAADGSKIVVGRHRNDFEPMAEVPVQCDPAEWNRLGVTMRGDTMEVTLNGRRVFAAAADDEELAHGAAALRTWNADARFRGMRLNVGDEETGVVFAERRPESVSGMWDPISRGDARGGYVLETGSMAFNGDKCQMMDYTGGEGIVGIANAGLNRRGMAVEKGDTLRGSVYLKGDGLQGGVRVALQSADGRREYTVASLPDVERDWKRYDFSLSPHRSDDSCRFAIYVDRPGRLWIDQATLMPDSSKLFRGLPVRRDIGEAMTDGGLTFLRYGGTMINAPEYRFKKMIGDRDSRPPYRGHWYEYSTNGFGIEDFLRFCEAAGFEAAFAVNIDETPEDMADMVEYLNGPADSEWGKVRAENGHPEPYGVKYISIGNEEVLFNGDRADEYDRYVERFCLLHDAIKGADPSIKLVCAAWWRPDSPNMERVFRALDGKADYWDYHPWTDGLNTGVEVSYELTRMRDLFRKWNPATTMKCAVFEENGNTHNMQRALGHALLQNAVRRMGDFVLTSCAANALQPYRQNDNGWDQGQIFFTPSKVWGMPPYYAQKMAAEYHEPISVECTVENGAGRLDVAAVRSEDGRRLVLHAVNMSGRHTEADLAIEGFGEAAKASAVTLAGAPRAVNTPDAPERITPVTESLTAAEAAKYEFPPYSYTILVFEK